MKSDGNLKTTGIGFSLMGAFFIIVDAIIRNMVPTYPKEMFAFILGWIFVLFGLALFIFYIVKKKKNQDLLKNGTMLDTNFVGTQKTGLFNYSDGWQYEITTEMITIGEQVNRVFTKKIYSWLDPKIVIEQNDIKTVHVFVNANNYDEYYMDTTCIEDKVVVA